MRRLILSLLIALAAPCVLASSAEGPKLLNANVDLSDKTGLQNGAKLFLNCCVSCHSASFMRYNRIAADLDIPEDQLKANLMFTTDKVGDPIKVAIS